MTDARDITGVFEYLPDAVLLTDRRGMIKGANGRAAVLRDVVKNGLHIGD